MVWSDSASDMSSVPNRPTTSSASTDYDSCGNTDAIVAYSPGVISAAKATRKYAPTSGTNGKWCLPAAGIMTKIYNNQSAIQDAIKKLGELNFRVFVHGLHQKVPKNMHGILACLLLMVWFLIVKKRPATFARYWSSKFRLQNTHSWQSGARL